MSTGDKIGIMERRRALETARTILYSKVGKMVLDGNKFPDRTLELEKKQIDTESRRNNNLIDNDKQMFKRGRLIYNLEPTIVIERPACSTCDIPTLDAFTSRKNKKKNLWEIADEESDTTAKFRSIIMQSPSLNEMEKSVLEKEYEKYRPPSANEEAARQRLAEKKRERLEMLKDAVRTPSPDAQDIFITQLEKQAMSSRSRFSSRMSQATGGSRGKPDIELKFNQFHLAAFEKIRGKQKQKFYNTIKL